MTNNDEVEKIEVFISKKNGKGEKFSIDSQSVKSENFAEILKRERKRKKISQLELAKMCGFNDSTYISTIELGKTNPSEKMMKKIAQMLGFKLVFCFESTDGQQE